MSEKHKSSLKNITVEYLVENLPKNVLNELVDQYAGKLCGGFPIEGLLPIINIDEETHNRFSKIAQFIFDLTDDVLEDIKNRDFLWLPTSLDKACIDNVINCYQVFSLESSERNPIESILSYLFDKTEPYYNDPYWDPLYNMEKEKEHVLVNLRMILEKYGTFHEYLDKVSQRLWKDKGFIKTSFSYYYNKSPYLLRQTHV